MILLLLLACNRQPQWPEERPVDACAGGPEGEHTLILDVDGKRRQALVWAPASEGPHDVVVLLHSYRSEPRRTAHYTGWVGQDVVLVAADGVSATWNAGACCGRARERSVDDVAFLDALVARVEETACTTGRVLATGLGNGGMMAQRWACESAVPDAVVSVGGGLQRLRCPQERPIPMVHYQVQGDGEKGSFGLEHTVERWAERNGAPLRGGFEDGELACLGDGPTRVCSTVAFQPGWPGADDYPVATKHPYGSATRAGLTLLEGATAPRTASPPTAPGGG